MAGDSRSIDDFRDGMAVVYYLTDRFILEFGAVSLPAHMTFSYSYRIGQECHLNPGKSNFQECM